MFSPKIQRALISVSDKTGLAELAGALVAAGVEIYSTGGTRKFLMERGLPAKEVAEYTGFPEMLEGRLKTLHPKIFGGLLGRADRDDDRQSLAEHGIATFELAVVNLYPFAQTIQKPGVTWEEAIEHIDIGGPSLVRAAAKNHRFTAIATRPEQYGEIIAAIAEHGALTEAHHRRLAAAAFAITAEYDATIADYFARATNDSPFPSTKRLSLSLVQTLRYGENPHQKAAVYALPGERAASVVAARQLHGKELSYNNLLDLDSALAIVRLLGEPAAAVIKHNNPCGAAVHEKLSEACLRALDGDRQSAYGGIIGLNRSVDAQTAEVLCEPGLFIEAIAAPSFEPAAVEALTTRPKWKNNVRLVEVGPLPEPAPAWSYRHIEGGLLVQEADSLHDPESAWRIVTEAKPSAELYAELAFAWSIVRHVKSNAIVITSNRSLAGAGAGQMSRVDSVDIAISKAGPRAAGGALASDAFFPFPDSIEKAAQAGVAGFIQPGGSIRDAEVIAACNSRGLPMIFTDRRHFKH
jgi:phosphoribosylaminoimidazolecarboxamide formyltransferase/IMP cyclohydrolase